MTRRPIIIGVTAILALALTAGFAYGAGRFAGHSQQNRRHIGTTMTVPAYSSNYRSGVQQGTAYAPAFRSQVRGWMRDWMRGHDRTGGSWTGTGYGQAAIRQSFTNGSGDYRHGDRHGYDDHDSTSGHGNRWMGGSGGYGDRDGWHDCW